VVLDSFLARIKPARLLFALIICKTAYAWSMPTQKSSGTLPKVNISYAENQDAQPANARIFCTGYGPPLSKDDASDLNPSVVRWGGNTSSRFNFKIGNIWNAGSDWHYANVTRGSRSLWIDWIRFHRDGGRDVIFTVPILGWLAKDGTTRGEPSSPNPSRTSVPMSDEDFKSLIAKLRDTLPSQERIYPLDNEPFQWHSIHGDAISKKIEPKEFARRWLKYAKLVREVDEQALISGPGLWGWADLPNLDPFLETVIGESDSRGNPYLNIVSAGIYPQNKRLLEDLSDITGNSRSTQTNQDELAELRVSTTANLDDETFVDPSWIGKPVSYFQNIEKSVSFWSNKKGLQPHKRPSIGIAEYNWGGHFTEGGAAAQAILLMKGLKLQLHHMCSFTWPPSQSQSGKVFRALREFVIGPNASKPSFSVFIDQNSRDPWLWLQAQKQKKRALVFVATRDATVILPPSWIKNAKSALLERFNEEKSSWQTEALRDNNTFTAKKYALYRVQE
jgi:hypothetical protein